MDNQLYWIWLTLKENITVKEMVRLIDTYKTAEAIYDINDKEELRSYSNKAIKDIMSKSLDMAKQVKQRIGYLGGYIVTIEDEEYPPLLRNIYYPPYVLYMMGEHLDWDNLLPITVVGTRTYDDYGRNVTEKISEELARAGATVVSGMARGIDGIAGLTAVRCGGKTIAVLGSGIDVIYPPEHAELYDAIRRNGVIITEYPPGTRPLRENFPRRNRIMAGISYGVLVTQAPKKSGALITSEYALENGRDIYAVPNNIFDKLSEGSNALLRQGAKAATCADDIISEYKFIKLTPLENKFVVKQEAKENKKEVDTSSLSKIQSEIVTCLQRQPYHIDELSREMGIESFQLDSELVFLEINGIVKKRNGNIYELS